MINKSNKQNIHYYETPQNLLDAIDQIVKPTEVVADIGCGIVPMNYFRPKLHFLIEPWKEYSDILSHRHVGDKSVVILRVGALEALNAFADNSVDSIFLLDVIEHLEKDDGFKILKEMERVARQQIVIFTPLGFMPQHMEAGEKDGWGLSGATVQEHRSGWLPEDFSHLYEFHICKGFHTVDYKGQSLAKTYGAFYAIAKLEGKISKAPEILSDIRRALPAEKELQILQAKYQKLHTEYDSLSIEHQRLKKENTILLNKYNELNNMLVYKFNRKLKNLIKRILGI